MNNTKRCNCKLTGKHDAEKQAEALIEYHHYLIHCKGIDREPMSPHEWASDLLERQRQELGDE